MHTGKGHAQVTVGCLAFDGEGVWHINTLKRQSHAEVWPDVRASVRKLRPRAAQQHKTICHHTKHTTVYIVGSLDLSLT